MSETTSDNPYKEQEERIIAIDGDGLLSETIANDSQQLVWWEDYRAERVSFHYRIDPNVSNNILVNAGRVILTKLGLRKQLSHVSIYPYAEENEEFDNIEKTYDELDKLNKRLNYFATDDAFAKADRILGIGTDNCKLPPFLQQIHQQFQIDHGTDVSFLEWAIKHASKDQQLNVWQWNKYYTDQHNNDPAFTERVAKIKESFQSGLEKVKQAGILHPSVTSDLERLKISVSNPLDPYQESVLGAFRRDENLVLINESAEDTTIYHELAHTLGRIGLFNEGITDHIAGAIYDQVHSTGDYIANNNSLYLRELESLQHLAAMSDGKINLQNMSELYAGLSSEEELQAFLGHNLGSELAELIGDIRRESLKITLESSTITNATRKSHVEMNNRIRAVKKLLENKTDIKDIRKIVLGD